MAGSDRENPAADPAAAVEFAERAAYLPAADALVVADLHAGRAATSSVDFPLGERADLTDRFGALLDRFDPGTAVLAGDLLHSFGTVPDGVPETLADLAGLADDAGAALVATPGNHDGTLDAVCEAAGVDLDCEAEVRLGDGSVVCHGHDEPDADADRYVVGHEHPAIDVEGRKHPCFLCGPGVYRGADLLVLPAFSRLARGTELNRMRTADCLSPLLVDLDACRPVVLADGDPLGFPPLGDLRRHL